MRGAYLAAAVGYAGAPGSSSKVTPAISISSPG
jgi:hypothetical protein